MTSVVNPAAGSAVAPDVTAGATTAVAPEGIATPVTANRLAAHGLGLRYGDRTIVDGLDLELPGNAVTAIVGPNACGKSTLLRGLVRLLDPAAGTVTLDGADIHRMPARTLAKRMGLLPQQPVTPEAVTVEALVRLGRYPHQRMLSPWSKADQAAVEGALARTGTAELRDRQVAGSPAGSASGSGSRSRSPRRPTCCCSTSRPPSWTCATSSTCSTWSPTCTPRPGAPSSWCCTTSGRPPGTPTTWWC